jgi:hypothetical protein
MPLTHSFPGPTTLTTTTEGRKDIAGLILRDALGNPRSGVFPRSPAALVLARSDMQVDVLAFEGCAVQFGGPILLANDGTTQVTIAAAPAANSRIDVVYAKQNENASPGTDADNNPRLGVVTGTPAAAPVKPALPTGALELAQVLMPAGAASTNASGVTITASNQFTTTAGGILWVRTRAERDALTNPMVGMLVFVLADSSMWVRSAVGSWAASGGGGLNPIIPTAIGGTGVTMQPGGEVDFAAATSISIDGVFSAQYDDYEIWLSGTSPAAGNVTVQFRVNGVTNTTLGNYRYAVMTWSNTATTPAGQGSASSGNILVGRSSGPGGTSNRVSLYGPNLVGETKGWMQAGDAGGAMQGSVWAASAIGQITGMLMTFGSAFTGTMRIFGVSKNQ